MPQKEHRTAPQPRGFGNTFRAITMVELISAPCSVRFSVGLHDSEKMVGRGLRGDNSFWKGRSESSIQFGLQCSSWWPRSEHSEMMIGGRKSMPSYEKGFMYECSPDVYAMPRAGVLYSFCCVWKGWTEQRHGTESV
ncbi:uncharacterized protein PV07_01726 [Cladophialophora immunda]|uniref:Uncharacterized protein n=1 Tax=Cladophialophora immunda TaxID=569365 RepID=A0A0D2DGX6_9EURO|nr:uncharacterized protein PV07_01726 [Cladophialophora immunda]KIW34999.1 hypothetical protein PV07_01726 [Cladophialophora immunda]